ncbi:hypothetical protein AN964_00800 [Heyndrickxia shackletonii]|uniref:Uncharacterized protein n=1 Tax=Heyndrickxia shackletonii TaxID=157838 RepID=A0A0Q3WUU1_9BACI|nr:hypothetical protein [Heyndrickxia shackletonii]KQL52219.1 hypothetical protein AN964_00800 [Heyndrickxia shackletonii]MBB2480846.1 hypothetical protein [Bacillus sp. APMAM]NEZ00237.1 hypothetical protein [Heyndrickxia shackletonii]
MMLKLFICSFILLFLSFVFWLYAHLSPVYMDKMASPTSHDHLKTWSNLGTGIFLISTVILLIILIMRKKAD